MKKIELTDAQYYEIVRALEYAAEQRRYEADQTTDTEDAAAIRAGAKEWENLLSVVADVKELPLTSEELRHYSVVFTDVDGCGHDVSIEIAVKRATDETALQMQHALRKAAENMDDWQYEDVIDEAMNELNMEFHYLSVTKIEI